MHQQHDDRDMDTKNNVKNYSRSCYLAYMLLIEACCVWAKGECKKYTVNLRVQ